MREVKADIHVDPAWRSWMREVLQQVRFWPDHKAIQKELLAHLEDGRADLMRLGYDQKLAEERTLRGIGDPVEIGKALDQAHKPGLGWLWQVSRWFTVLAAVWMLLAVLGSGGLPDVRQWIEPASTWEREDTMPDDIDCPASFQAGAYTFEVIGVRYDLGTLHVELQSFTPKFWLGPPELHDYLEAVDSCGTVYTPWANPRISGSSYQDGHIRNRLWITLYNIEEEPEWIDIRHKNAGWSFRLELPSGREEGAP